MMFLRYFILLISLCCVSGNAWAAYRLQKGDDVLVTIAGLPSLSVSAFVNSDGKLDLAWLGTFDALGQSVEDVEERARAAARGQIIRQYDREGQVYTISLDGTRLDLQLTGYRPIIVSGDVVASGTVAFTPGITVREAVALAGGVSTLFDPTLQPIDPVKIIEWRSAYQEAALARIDAKLRVWRLASQLGRDWNADFPALDSSVVSRETILSLSNEQKKMLEEAQRRAQREEAYHTAAVKQAEHRIAILDEQMVQQEQVALFEQEEEARVRALVENGLSPSNRLTDIKRAVVSTATQLLDIQESLSAAELFLLRLQDDYEEGLQRQRMASLEDLRRAQSDLRKADIRVGVLTQVLGISTQDDLSVLMPTVVYSATLFRKSASSVAEIPVGKDTVLQPGDLIEVVKNPLPQILDN